MENIIFFLLLIISIIVFYIANRKNSKLILIIGISILSCISGLRGINVGIDTQYYYDAFLRSFPRAWQFDEIGFRIITNFLMKKIDSPTIVMLIYACITNFLIFFRLWDFRKKCNFTFMSLLYILIFFIDSMNIMRQFIAISIIFFATRLLEKKKYIWFIIVILLCTYIHKSCLLALIIFAIYIWKLLSKKNKIMLTIPIIALSIVIIRFVYNYESVELENYLSNSNAISNLNITFIYRFSIFMVSYLINYKQINNDLKGESNKDIKERSNEFNIISRIYCAGLLLGSFGMFYSFLTRIGYYCLFFELLYWGFLTYKGRNKKMNMIMIMIYAIYIFALEVINNGSGIFPYYYNFL